ncbi:MAG: hypothetical protein EBY21_09720, partial [Alphaproteobacteria bacterium]|nr:hypothetical protein [Alphaproteobacteria bacterium]
SYKRLVPGFEAPVHISWARNNRSGLIRVPIPKKGNVKVLGEGSIAIKLIVEGCSVSATAKEKIEKAGGSIV